MAGPRHWDEEDDDKTPYGMSSEALPAQPDPTPMEVPRRRAGRLEDINEELDEPIVVQPKNPFEVAEEQAQSQPKRKKKRKALKDIAMPDDEDTRRAKDDERYEWRVTGALFGIGLLFIFLGSWGASRKEEFEDVKAFAMVLSSILGLVVVVPAIMFAMVVGGSIMGIEYGTPLSAARNIAGIITFCNGLDWLGVWIGTPMIMYLFSTLVLYSLFMSRFSLDPWEIIVTVLAIRAVLTAAVFAMIFVAFLISGKQAKKKEQALVTPAASAIVAVWHTRCLDKNPLLELTQPV